jgi:hypothetical protein
MFCITGGVVFFVHSNTACHPSQVILVALLACSTSFTEIRFCFYSGFLFWAPTDKCSQ